MVLTRGQQRDEAIEVSAKNSRDSENPLRSMLAIRRTLVKRGSADRNNDTLLRVDKPSSTNDNGHQNILAPNNHNVDGHANVLLPILKEKEGENRSCVDATVSRLVQALVSACLASTSIMHPVPTADSQPPSVEEVAGTVVTPLILQSSKGAGTEECRDSARALLRFFGHAPLLHLEGIIWVKMSGQRGECFIEDSPTSGGDMHVLWEVSCHISTIPVEYWADLDYLVPRQFIGGSVQRQAVLPGLQYNCAEFFLLLGYLDGHTSSRASPSPMFTSSLHRRAVQLEFVHRASARTMVDRGGHCRLSIETAQRREDNRSSAQLHAQSGNSQRSRESQHLRQP